MPQSDVEEAVLEELDGNRPRRLNPLTIIQVKDPEKNVDVSIPWYNVSSSKKASAFTLIGLCLLCAAILTLIFGGCGYSDPDKSFTSSTCDLALFSTNVPADRRQTWSKILEKIVLVGGIAFVEVNKIENLQQESKHRNTSQGDLVVSGYLETSNISSGFWSHSSTVPAGFIGFTVSEGQESWRIPLNGKPSKHDCHLVDISGDGIHDCLVIGSHGLLAAINPLNGVNLWTLHHHIPLANLSLPRKLPDLDGDSVSELVSACAVTLPSGLRDDHVHIRTNFVLLSGKTGEVIGRPYLVETCTDLAVLNVTSSLSLQFDCISSIGADQFEMSLMEFYSKVTNGAMPIAMKSTLQQGGSQGWPASRSSGVGQGPDPRAEQSYHQFSRVGEDRQETVKDSIHLDWAQLVPDCPECGVNVKIWDGFAHRVLWNHTWHNSVAFQPLSTRFETERWDSPIEGFVFRLWTWSDPGNTFTSGKGAEATMKGPESTRGDADEGSVKVTSSSTPLDDPRDQEDYDDPYSLENFLYKSDGAWGGQALDDNDQDDRHGQPATSPLAWIPNVIPFSQGNFAGVGVISRRLQSVSKDAYYRDLNSIPDPGNLDGGPSHSGKARKEPRKGPWTNYAGSSAAVPMSASANLFRSKADDYDDDVTRFFNVTETIYYATLNHTDPQLTALFSHNVIQRCRLNSNRYECLPHFDTMKLSMVIKEDTRASGSNPDTKELIFATQSLVRGVNKLKNRKQLIKDGDKFRSSNNLIESLPGRSKKKLNIPIRESHELEESLWILQTQLHKRKLTKSLEQTMVEEPAVKSENVKSIQN